MHYVDYANELICNPRTWEYMESKPTFCLCYRFLENTMDQDVLKTNFSSYMLDVRLIVVWMFAGTAQFVQVINLTII